MHDELVASREAVSASAEDLEDSRLVLDVLDSLISTVSDRESEGEEFGADFEMAVHGVLPPPAEARAIRRDWEVWKKVTERFVNEWESGSLRTDLSRFRRTGEF